jgi:hypothetical protein
MREFRGPSRHIRVKASKHDRCCTACDSTISAGENYLFDRLSGVDTMRVCALCVAKRRVRDNLRRSRVTRGSRLPEGVRILDWCGDGYPWEVEFSSDCKLLLDARDEFLALPESTIHSGACVALALGAA